MKKLLIATAALAMVAGTAQAQSSVTVYGNIDLSWQNVDNDQGQTAGSLSRNALSSSRLGFKGEEDLGGGLKAGFVLEAAIDASKGQAGTTGTNNSSDVTTASTLFDRAAYVSLSSAKFGELRLGRQDVTYANDIDSGVSQMGNMGNFNTSVNSVTIGDNKDNTIVYVSPTFSGVQVQAGYSSANTISSTTNLVTEASTGNITSMLISYINGPVKAYAARQDLKAADSSADADETIFGASYDAGFASFGVARQSGNSDATTKSTQTNYSVAVPVAALGSGVKLHAAYLDNKSDTTANSGIQTTRFGITKALSKRTTVYGAFSSADYDSAYATAALRNKTVKTTAAGINHVF